MGKRVFEKIGVMDFHGSVDITDPCYNRDVWCRMNDVKIKEGEYSCMVSYKEDSYFGCTRVGTIGIFLNGIVPNKGSMKKIGEIGVDAGVAGFFHNKPDYSRDEWMNFCDGKPGDKAWMREDGFYSESGYGDGGYSVYAYEQEGEIVALEIRFIM